MITYPSTPTQHDLWRRVDANWLAGMVVCGIVDMLDAEAMIRASAYELPRNAYKLGR